PLKEITDPNGRRRYRGNIDVELAIDAIEMAPTLDHLLLFSGDGAFRRMIEAVQRKGVRATVVSTLKTQPPMIADELRRQADSFIELHDLAAWIARERRPTVMPDRERAEPASTHSDHPEI
ncbi:MAG: NYN domain-containing protein, partial [Geminicoccaceae bacterium]